MHKFMQRSCVRIFCNERTRSTPFDPKLMFWGVLDRFVTARTSVQNGPNWCNQCIGSWNEVASEFFARNAPNPPHWTPNSCFVAFRTILLLHELWCKTTITAQSCNEVMLEFFATNAPDPPHLNPNSCFGAF
jgi:hypothetical protein